MPEAELTTQQAVAPGADAEPLLEVFDLSKTWKKPPLKVLSNINLEIGAGEMVLIEGRNGVGKTTLLRIIAGLIGPDTGFVRALGLHPFRDRREYHRHTAFLSAGNTGVYARLTVRQQLDLWAKVSFIPRAVRAAAIEETIEEFELTELADRRSDRLSLGQRQRMRLGMTFVSKPKLVFLDEPRSSLDGEGGEVLARAIRNTAARGGAVLWVSPTGEHFEIDFTQRYLLEAGGLQPR